MASPSTYEFRNFIDVPPFVFTENNGTNFASIYVEKDEPTEVYMVFDEPIRGFFADFTSPADGEILMLCYNADMDMVGQFTFSMFNESHGFVLAPESPPITQITMKAANSSFAGEGFGMDNVEIACAPQAPVPTLSTWFLLVLAQSLSILGTVVLLNKRISGLWYK